MIYIEKDINNIDDFIVLDEEDDPVVGLSQGDFTILLYDPSGVNVANMSGGTEVIISEIGEGVYRISFTPDELGNWTLLVYNSTYFDFGKGENYQCVESLAGESLKTLVERILGLSQENYRIIDPVYDRANNLIDGLIKIYPTASDVDTDTNAIAEYRVSATYGTGKNRNIMNGYKVKKIT